MGSDGRLAVADTRRGGLWVPAGLDFEYRDDFEYRMRALHYKLRSTAKGELDKDGQKALTILSTQLPYIARTENLHTLALAEISASAFSSSQKGALKLAQRLRRRLWPYWFFPSPTVAILFGLLCSIPLLFVLLRASRYFLTLLGAPDTKALLDTPLEVLFLVAATGALGSIVSILLRCRTAIIEAKIWGPTPLFLTGFGKPFVGVAFALFIFACLKSDFIFNLGEQDVFSFRFLALALGFIAGFSERFATDVITKVSNGAETKTSGSSQAAPNKRTLD